MSTFGTFTLHKEYMYIHTHATISHLIIHKALKWTSLSLSLTSLSRRPSIADVGRKLIFQNILRNTCAVRGGEEEGGREGSEEEQVIRGRDRKKEKRGGKL